MKKSKALKNNQSRIIRMVYVAYEKFISHQDNSTKLGEDCCWSRQYQLPDGMSLEDACKVISYLSEKVEKENHLEEASKKSVMTVSSILKDYGFKAVEGTEGNNVHGHGDYLPPFVMPRSFCEKVEGVTDFITYNAPTLIFKLSGLGKRYFDWYTPNVTKEEFDRIYKSINLDINNEEVEEQSL